LKVHWSDRFRNDYQKLEKRLGNGNRVSFRKALWKATSILQKGNDLSAKYTVNRIVSQGPGWYICYVLDDIVMTYKIEGQYIKLSRIGFAKELGKE